jgi:predicted  nucleic acid-binding Zn-ribbon protein
MSDLLQDVELDEGLKEQLSSRFNEALQAKLNEETAGLKNKVDELLAEKKKVQQEREEARMRAKQEAEDKAAKENDYKQLFESQKQEADTLRSTIEKMNADIRQQKVSTEAAKLASRLTKDTQRAQLLQKEISQRLTLVDNELRVTDESGQLTVSSLDDLANAIRTAYPFLVDGSQASGGGAVKAQGGAEARKEVSRAAFDKMDQRQRSEFFKSGGKIFDE